MTITNTGLWNEAGDIRYQDMSLGSPGILIMFHAWNSDFLSFEPLQFRITKTHLRKLLRTPHQIWVRLIFSIRFNSVSKSFDSTQLTTHNGFTIIGSNPLTTQNGFLKYDSNRPMTQKAYRIFSFKSTQDKKTSRILTESTHDSKTLE